MAMAPVAVQCSWSMQASASRRGMSSPPDPRTLSPQDREALWHSNLNTCHVWADQSEHVAVLRAGGEPELPLPIRQRYDDLGLDPGDRGPT